MSNPVETPVAPAPEPGPGGRLGPIGRARASLTAIETLLRLREDEAAPTPEDLAALRQWPGWGPLAPALAENREGTWAEIGEELQRLLSPREYRQAEQGTPTAYYTPDRITEACWTALRDLGFSGGRILEPGCGAGTFINHTPDRMPVEWFGVERDPTTAGIAALLHPDAQIINSRLQEAGLQSNSVDAVLGNVPYGNFQVHDKTAPKAVTDSIHNYFIWRSVQALRPGGIAILLTSRYTLDSQDQEARAAIARHADLLGAIRLPNGALAEGGTGVLADILILRRQDSDRTIYDNAHWMGTSGVPGVPDQECNDYFLRHPENVLGEFEQGRAAQYGHTLAVKPPEGQDLAAALGEAFDGITAAARDAGRDWRVAVGAQPFTEDTLPFPVREDGRKEGSFHLVDGKPHEVVDGELVAVERAGKELPKLIALRDAALKLIEAETDHDTPDAQLDPLRAEVNRLYDVYLRAHGPINRFTLAEGQVDEETGEKAVSRRYPRLGGFRRDPDVVSVLALEDFDDETQKADKSPLLLRRVNRRIERPTSAETPEEALSLCLNFKNKIDVPTIAQLLGIEENQVQGALGELVFPDPDNGELLTRGAYLSGPVVDKLERAEFLLSQGRDDLQRHVDELREVQPEPLPPEDIKAKLGAPWIPVEDVTAFAEEMLGVRVDILNVAKTATWNVDMPMTIPEAATSEWGTSRVNAFELLDLALNGQAPKVYDTFRTPDGGSRRVRNDKETMLAESKMTALMRRFASWVWEDPDRADRLAADYNRIFNSTVLPKHDGSHLTVDGMDPEFKPYEHQWDFVQRVLSAEEGSLCPYPVGAGKTATMFMTATKLKQLGLVNKPMIVVPNHLLEQISRDGKKLFPNAKILMAGKKDLADARSRMLFAARCATGDWDAIVMTHNSFGRLGVHPVTEATYLEELANEYRVALSAIDGDDANQRRIKEIAKMVDRFDARASDLRSKATDAGVTYENLGVDFIQVDEAHLFKNLALPATTEGMSLGKPSKRATDLDLKLIVTRERTGRDNVTALYSGTFISNSVREMYVFKHYTMPKRMEKLGLGSPDAWAANFIQFESRPEVGVDGVSFRLKRRPVEYTNADEALALFAEVAELRPREQFKIKRPKRADRFVEIDATPNLIQYVGHISDRIDLIQQGKVKPFEDNMLNVITDGRKAALDLELVGMEPDGPGKAGAIIRNVLQIHERTKDLKLPGDPDDVSGGLQLVFCDLGTPSKERGSQVYGKVRRGLIDGLPEDGLPGIPRERIRFIHDYNSDLAKEQLFTDARSGKVSVLFMSSEKGGTGVNVQTRGVALHHADPPHKPAEWEQREGRLDRPGNLLIDLDMEVEFLRYIALNSFDSYMFQQLERKQRPIVQIMSGRKVGRVIQEIDPVGAGFGQAKAVATGNPMLLELADVNGELTMLLNDADGHRQAQARMKRKVEVLGDQIREAERTLPAMRAMADAVTAAGDDDTWRTADGRLIDPDDVAGVLAQTAQGSKPTLDLDAGYLWRGLNVGLTWHRRQQFGGMSYEGWAHLVAGDHQVDVRLNLSWFGKGQSWRIVKALGEAADEAVTAPAEIEQKVAKQRVALEDTRSHIGRPFEKHAALEAVRERKAALEDRISGAAIASGNESGSGPQFDPGAAGAEMTEAEMAMHDATAMAGMLGGTAIVVSGGQIIGGARVVDRTDVDLRTPDLTDPRQWDEAVRAFTTAAAANADVRAWAQIDANEGEPFREGFAGWAQEWALERANLPEDRPTWLRAWLDPEGAETRRAILAEAAGIAWRQARAATDPDPAPAPEMVRVAAVLRYYEPLFRRHGLFGTAAAAVYISRPGYGYEYDVDNPLHDMVARMSEMANRLGGIYRNGPAVDGWVMYHVGLPRLQASTQLSDVAISLTNLMTDSGSAVGSVDLEAILAAPPGTVIDLPPLPDRNSGQPIPGPEANPYADAQQMPPDPGLAPEPVPAPEESATPPAPPQAGPEEPAPPVPEAPAEDTVEPAPAPTDPPTDLAGQGQAPLQDLVDAFGDRVMVGHIGGPQPARTHQSAGWAIMAVLSDDQVRGLVSAVAVDGQPVSMEPGVMPTDRVREWIAEQQQTPTTAFYASTSSELPPALRGDGDVRLSSRADGLTIEQGDVTTTILWEELPAWIDAAVAHNTANRDPYKPWWRHGNLSAEIHFRRDDRNQAIRTAMDALADALRETVPPTDEQLAEARDRYAPPAAVPATTTDPAVDAVDVPAEESAPQESTQQLPEAASPVPGAEGYHYTEEGRTVRLYTEAGEEVGTAKWSYSKYRYLGDVQGDIVRGTEDGATVAKRMANHHAVVYGDRVHRPTLDDQGRDPVWILHNGSDTLVFGVSPEDDTAKAAMWTGGGFKESRKVGGWYLPRTWKEPTRRQRVDDAVRVLAAAGRTVTVHTTREERQQPPQRPARLPELNVTAPNLDEVPQFFNAAPFTDRDDLADVQRLESAYARWGQHPTVRAYLQQDSDARPDGFGTPDNPIAELHIAYHRARLALREPVPGGPDEIVRRVYGVAAWCQALEPAVEQDLLDPLQDVYAAAHGLAARSQATIAALTAEQTAAAEDAPAPAPEQEAPAAAQQEPGTGDQPGEPTPAPTETAPAAAAEEQAQQGPTDLSPAAPEPPAATAEPAPDDGSELPVVSDEFAILYASYRELVPAGVADDGVTWDTSRIVITGDGVRVDGPTVERLMDAGLLEYGATLNVDITPAGRQRINELERTERPEPAVGDRVLFVATGRLGIVGGYATKEHGREAEVVCDRDDWPNGWDIDIAPLYLVTVEPGAMEPEAAAEAYRVAALRQFPGTLTDPALRGPALEAMTAAALAAPRVAQAARANDLNNFIFPLAAWVDEWVTEEWADVTPDDWPDWVRAYFRSGDDAIDDRNGLYAELAGPIYVQLRTTEPDPAPALDLADTEQETTEAEPEPDPAAEPEEQLDLSNGGNDSTPVPQETPPEPAPASDATPDTPAPEPAPAPADPAPADPEPDAPEPEAAGTTDEEEGQLDLFGEAAPAPAPAQRPGRRRGRREPEPAVSPGTEGAPDGRLGVYGHADHGECERCGTTDTDRYTVVLHWFGSDHGEMAAECGPCVELTLGLPYQQYQRLADVAEARRDGLRIQPRPHPQDEVVVYRRTAENEWTSVHRPTGQRYRTAKESESGYRGFVTRDLSGLSQGTGGSVGSIREITERAALGRTAETHPTDSDDWVYFSYGQDLKDLGTHVGETITARSSGPRKNRAPLEHGPRWDLGIGDTDFTVEMVYQQGLPGQDGHRLVVTDQGDESTRHVQWNGVLEWARERVRDAETEQADAVTAAPPAVQQEPAQPVPDPEPEEAPADAPAETTVPDDAPGPDAAANEGPDQPEQEEAVAGEPEPTSVATDTAPAVDPPAAEEVAPGVDVEDPPVPRTFTETAPLAADARYQLRLTSVEGEGLREGELLYGEITVAAVRLSANGRWFARMTVDDSPADVTALTGSPQDAAHQGAIMFAVVTGEPYGEPPVAADARGRLSRADVLRVELRTVAEQHLRTITVAAARANPNYPQNPQFQALSDQLGNLGAADVDNHGSRQMAANLTAVQQAVNTWGAALPVDPALDERQHLAFPLLNLLYDTTRLHARLQATLDAVQADRATAQQQEAAAPAPAEPARDDSVQQAPGLAPEPAPDSVPAPGPERAADATSTDQPAPSPEAPEDPEMATPARPATPENREANDPEPAATGATSEPGDGQPAQGEAAPEPYGDMPPWTEWGDMPLSTDPADTSGPMEDRPVDVVGDFAAVQEAWDEHVSADKGTGADLFATVEDELLRLEALFADAVAKMAPDPEPQPAPEAAPVAEAAPAATVQPAAPEPAAAPSPAEPEAAQPDRDPQQAADAVNTALRETDAHAPALQDLPEWQRIQSVRGAFGHLMHVIRERAGEHLGDFLSDNRVGDYLRRLSIRACEKVAGWAQAGADWLRSKEERGTEQRGELPSAEALLRLGDAALEYSGPRRGGGTPPPPPSANGAANSVDIPAMRKMGEALNRPLPGAKRGVSTAAARGRSTTTAKRGGKKPAPGGTEQAGHLRRGETEQSQPRKPTQR